MDGCLPAPSRSLRQLLVPDEMSSAEALIQLHPLSSWSEVPASNFYQEYVYTVVGSPNFVQITEITVHVKASSRVRVCISKQSADDIVNPTDNRCSEIHRLGLGWHVLYWIARQRVLDGVEIKIVPCCHGGGRLRRRSIKPDPRMLLVIAVRRLAHNVCVPLPRHVIRNQCVRGC